MRLRRLIPYAILLAVVAVVLAIIFIPRNKPEVMPEVEETEVVKVDEKVEGFENDSMDSTREDETGGAVNEQNTTQTPTSASTAQPESGTIVDTSKP
jgi:hypothetical protein